MAKGKDDTEIFEEVSKMSKSMTTMFTKSITSKSKKRIEQLINRDPRTKKKIKNPKDDIMNDLNIC
jgi:hypothetical protein